MKKALYSLGLLALVAGTTVTFQSCNKIKEEIAKQINPINFSQQNVTLTIPAVSADSVNSNHVNVPIDIEQLIKDNAPSGSEAAYNLVKTIKIKKITLTIVEGQSATNNWTNFEGIFFIANTTLGISKNLPNQGVWVTIGDEASNQFGPVVLEFPEPHTNLKEYFDGSGKANADYFISAAVRRPTTEMKVNAVIDYEAGFN
jgi:hypothetical protein